MSNNRKQKFKQMIQRMVKEEVRNAFSSFKRQLKQEILNEVNTGGGQNHVRNINQRRQQSNLGRQAGQQQQQRQQQGGFSQQADNMITEYNQQGGQKQMLQNQYRDVMQGQMGGGQQQPEQGSIPIDDGLAKRWGELNNKLKNKKHMSGPGGGGAQGPSPNQVKNSWKPGMFNDKDSVSEDARRKLREANNNKGGNGKQQLNG